MSARSPEEQIRELARDLTPVRPVPALRSVLGVAAVLGLAAPAAYWLLGGPGLRPGGAVASGFPYLATLAGLALVAFGALGAGLAAAVPGREASRRLGARVAAAGFVLAVAGGIWGLVSGDPPTLGNWLSCVGRALALGAAPTLLGCAFIVYAAVRRPGSGAALALAGGVALGAAAVHATCPSDSPMHWLLAHSLAPLVAILVLTAPLAALLARRTRRERDASRGPRAA